MEEDIRVVKACLRYEFTSVLPFGQLSIRQHLSSGLFSWRSAIFVISLNLKRVNSLRVLQLNILTIGDLKKCIFYNLTI